MQTTDTIQSRVPDPVKDNWHFLEVWIDPMQSPPYLLLLLANQDNHYYILDPAQDYSLIKTLSSYQEAEVWLLEDEYEPLEGRLFKTE